MRAWLKYHVLIISTVGSQYYYTVTLAYNAWGKHAGWAETTTFDFASLIIKPNPSLNPSITMLKQQNHNIKLIYRLHQYIHFFANVRNLYITLAAWLTYTKDNLLIKLCLKASQAE